MVDEAAESTVLIRGGTLATERAVFVADILLRGERVVEVAPSIDPAAADDVIDATGDLILPGALDLHVHFEEPGPTQREGYWTGTQAAAAGGITTVVEHPLSDPPTTTAERYGQKRAQVEPSAHVDFGLWGGAVPGNADEFAGMVAEGAPGFKVFTIDSEPEYPPIQSDAMDAVMTEVARLGSSVVIHAEDQATIDEATATAMTAGRTDPRAWAESRPPQSEEVAVGAAVAHAERTGCRTLVAHLSTAGAVAAALQARKRGAIVAVETCPHFLVLDEDDLVNQGAWAKTAPPLRSHAEQAGLWRAVADGQVDLISSDHAPWEPAEKEKGESSIWDAPNGLQSLQLMMVILLDAWERQGLPLEHLVRLTSAAPARWLGLYPHKGAIEPGSDGDIVIYRTGQQRAVRATELLNRHQWTPFEGKETRYSVRTTLLRGSAVYDDGAIVGRPRGRFISMGGAV